MCQCPLTLLARNTVFPNIFISQRVLTIFKDYWEKCRFLKQKLLSCHRGAAPEISLCKARWCLVHLCTSACFLSISGPLKGPFWFSCLPFQEFKHKNYPTPQMSHLSPLAYRCCLLRLSRHLQLGGYHFHHKAQGDVNTNCANTFLHHLGPSLGSAYSALFLPLETVNFDIPKHTKELWFCFA